MCAPRIWTQVVKCLPFLDGPSQQTQACSVLKPHCLDNYSLVLVLKLRNYFLNFYLIVDRFIHCTRYLDHIKPIPSSNSLQPPCKGCWEFPPSSNISQRVKLTARLKVKECSSVCKASCKVDLWGVWFRLRNGQGCQKGEVVHCFGPK